MVTLTMPRIALAALAGACLPACILVSDFSGLDDGMRATDGATLGDAADEAEVSTQAATDGSVETCKGARFCDTFASGDLAEWTRPFNADPSTIGLKSESFVTAPSPPNVLHLSIAPRPSSGTFAYLSKDGVPATAGTSASLAFRIFVERIDPAESACIAGLVFNDGTGAEHVVRLLVGKTSAYVEERFSGKTNTLTLDGTIALGTWQRVVLAVTTKGRITVTLDDVKKLDAPTDASWTATKTYRLVLGVNFVAGTATNLASGFDLRFDDVRLDGD